MAVRLSGRKRPGGGRVELVLVKAIKDRSWQAFIKGRIQPGQVIEIGPDAEATVVERNGVRSLVSIETNLCMNDFLAQYGQMPLPPYVKRMPTEADRHWYQTIFAREEGAIAAPTAGLHFTEELLRTLKAAGIGLASVTLHVGPGTFSPVSAKHVEDHVMSPERFVVSHETCRAISETKARGGRVVAVGTTVVRALEAASEPTGAIFPQRDETKLFILPGYCFRVVDSLMTNFHLPRTTLVMLVAAYLGRQRLLAAYQEAVQERYRFYSYGDAMLII
jgi:S-adenosylmethionine:tRNA ribosyltransferase-isomerase